MANTRKARNQGQNQPSAEAPVDSEIRRAAERIGHKPREVCTTYVGDVEDRIALLREATDEIISCMVSPEPDWRAAAFVEALRLVRSVRWNLEQDVSDARKGVVSP